MHPELQFFSLTSVQDYPCKYVHTGQECYSGNKCRFSHAPLNAETKRIVDAWLNPAMRDEILAGNEMIPPKPSLLGKYIV